MSNFVHFVTTRFNVPTANWYRTREGGTPLTEEWHEHRFDLFQKFTFPSFENQSVKEFIWIVYFDEATAPKYREIIRNLENKFSNFKPQFLAHGGDINDNIGDLFRSWCKPETQFVISSDIDNDDLLHKDYIKTVQLHFQPVHDTVIDLRRGLQLILQNDNKALALEYYGVANPFVSLVEDINKMKTIMNEYHLNFRSYPLQKSYDEKPMFIQLIHEQNLMNAPFQTKALSGIDLRDFGVVPEKQPEFSSGKTFSYNVQRYLKLLQKRFIK